MDIDTADDTTLTGTRALALARRIIDGEPGRPCEPTTPGGPAATLTRRVLAMAGHPSSVTAAQVRRLEVPDADYSARRLLAACQPDPDGAMAWGELPSVLEALAMELGVARPGTGEAAELAGQARLFDAFGEPH